MVSCPNLRDIGGHAARDGKLVRTGLAYRSDQLNPVADVDAARLAGLGLTSVFDLRSPDEAAARPDHLPPGVRYASFDVLVDARLSGLDDFERLLRDPARANAVLGGGRVNAVLARVYRGFVSLPSACEGFRQLFLSLGRRDDLPLLFHCATGKDRTGWAAAALLTLLGVPRAAVLEDFLASNGYILPRYAPVIDAFAAAGGERAILTAIFGVNAAHLDLAFDEMTMRHGSIERYFADGLGIDASAQDALRTLYLEADSRPSGAHPEVRLRVRSDGRSGGSRTDRARRNVRCPSRE
jgi:protein-tyrosine phosphatase